MGYSITFYNVVDPPNKIKKNLGDAIGATGVCSPWEPTTDLSGSVLTNYSAAIESSNYCHITGDGRERYCYIREFEKVPGGQMRIQLDVDPLMTFQTEILACDCYCTRTSQQPRSEDSPGYNMLMNDNKIPLVAYDRAQVIGPDNSGGLVLELDPNDYNVYASIIGTEGTYY